MVNRHGQASFSETVKQIRHYEVLYLPAMCRTSINQNSFHQPDAIEIVLLSGRQMLRYDGISTGSLFVKSAGLDLSKLFNIHGNQR